MTLYFADGTPIEPFYRCLTCGALVSESTLSGMIRDGDKCSECNNVGWVKHDPQISTSLQNIGESPT